MDFARKQLEFKTIVVMAVVTFCMGRINLFGGTFPAAIAWVSVMMAVSTVNVYYVPVLAGSMCTFIHKGVTIWGDLLAVLCLAAVYLFFHQRRFSIGQRTLIAVAVCCACHGLWYGSRDMLFLLDVEDLLKEGLAVMIYLRVFNTVAKLVYQCGREPLMSKHKAAMALDILLVSLIGSLGQGYVVLALWTLLICLLQLQEGLQRSFSVTATAAVFWYCQGESQVEVFLLLLCGLLAGWYGAAFVERRYGKSILAAAVFALAGLYEGMAMYSIGTAMLLLLLLPTSWVKTGFCLVEERLMPEYSTERDLQLLAIRQSLLMKYQAFRELGRLYSEVPGGKEIISYQFMGMARTLERLLQDLQGGRRVRSRNRERHGLAAISVGQASYAFEEISGDSMGAFAFHDHDVALVISDGMGKGRHAAQESQLVVSTLTRLLQAGFDVDLAMKTINGILMTDNKDERFATVDLTIIDRQKCRAKIFKMGAATTFIKHQGTVSVLKRQALPAGVTKDLQLEYIDVKLRKGDILVMVSDGVTDCDRQDPQSCWLRERLLEIQTRNPETIAELLVNKAAEKYGLHERDDLTVVAAAIDV